MGLCTDVIMTIFLIYFLEPGFSFHSKTFFGELKNSSSLGWINSSYCVYRCKKHFLVINKYTHSLGKKKELNFFRKSLKKHLLFRIQPLPKEIWITTVVWEEIRTAFVFSGNIGIWCKIRNSCLLMNKNVTFIREK